MMAAGALLRDAGAGEALDGGAWSAAYAYYGHDLFGIDYANQVMGRAQGWELYGFCVNCPWTRCSSARSTASTAAMPAEQLLAAEQREDEEERAQARRAREAPARAPKAPRDAPDREDVCAGSPSRPRPRRPRPPEPETTAPPPAAVTEPPAQPAAPPPPAKECSKLERLLGCAARMRRIPPVAVDLSAAVRTSRPSRASCPRR